MTVPSHKTLSTDNIEHIVVFTTRFGYEWVYGVTDTERVDGRKATPHFDEQGELTEMVVEMGEYYGRPIDTLISDTAEVLGYAKSMEEAAALAESHYRKRSNA
jgi:hypothetical protein